MAKSKPFFDNFDTPYEVQPPKGSAEGPIDYGRVTALPKDFNDPLGVLPEEAKPKNIGPSSSEG